MKVKNLLHTIKAEYTFPKGYRFSVLYFIYRSNPQSHLVLPWNLPLPCPIWSIPNTSTGSRELDVAVLLVSRNSLCTSLWFFNPHGLTVPLQFLLFSLHGTKMEGNYESTWIKNINKDSWHKCMCNSHYRNLVQVEKWSYTLLCGFLAAVNPFFVIQLKHWWSRTVKGSIFFTRTPSIKV